MTMEIRTVEGKELELRAIDQDEGVLTGYAAVFNQPTKIRDRNGDTYTEEIAPGAFKRALESGKEIFALRNHDFNVLLGSNVVNLRLWEDQHGLRFELKRAETPEFESARAAVRSRLLRYCSFGFNVPKDGAKWTMRGNMKHRQLIAVDLGEITLTHIPAYSTTSVEVRSIDLGQKPESQDPEKEKRYQELREKYALEGSK